MLAGVNSANSYMPYDLHWHGDFLPESILVMAQIML